jgi:hypothetical protein
MAGKGPSSGRGASGGGSGRGERNVAPMSARTQTALVVCVLVATVVLVYVLQGALDLDTVQALLVGSLLIVVVGLGFTWLLVGARRHQIAVDGRATCEPILERYGRTHNATRLVSDYDAWRKQPHDPQLVYTFTRATVEALVDAHHYKQARRQLALLAEMPATPRTRQEFEDFRRECQRRMSGR